ncbi:YciI-like protein [Arthrobacter sp. MAHUQ-56]
MHAVLEYTYEDNYLETREKYRADHLKAGWEAVERGELLLGGAIGDGPFTGLLIFSGENPLEAAQAFAAADPYVAAGVVTSWTARPWTTVLGNEAATPVRP